MHKIVHTTAIVTLGTPIFNNFSFNVKLYVNKMDIINNKFYPTYKNFFVH
jgi:hypothetical protein